MDPSQIPAVHAIAEVLPVPVEDFFSVGLEAELCVAAAVEDKRVVPGYVYVVSAVDHEHRRVGVTVEQRAKLLSLTAPRPWSTWPAGSPLVTMWA
ncbi:hypothetical protein P2Q00_49045 [Streptomyces coacervatus]|uniref:hypothetical protein n=1 Tax=Streptomyces coacervatus TaxID=647381 RepID=UPI0023DCE61A|nr:hypothetical protein [Streptomyces coacervatus]MDF2273283.1 hypothetical protein [Streptomyces coacervatus]